MIPTKADTTAQEITAGTSGGVRIELDPLRLIYNLEFLRSQSATLIRERHRRSWRKYRQKVPRVERDR
jgi:hypothetical protein